MLLSLDEYALIHCTYFIDDILNDSLNGEQVTFIGTGDPDECVELINDIVYKVQDPDHCSPKPCAIGSVYQPSIKNQTFYAVSAFYFPLWNLGVVNNTDHSFSPAETTQAAYQYCRKVRQVRLNNTAEG